ncbi:hypothetical protein [Fibrobacter sp.]|uniref:hypothetical protein n=1 Tax=Fibrobacter sp. TaxID=35828 RepID=UPI00386CD245
MSIRKCKRKLALCIAAIFWAGCDSDSNSSAPVIPNNPGEITPSDATEETQTPDPQSSDSEATAPTSSSEEEAIPSSESFDEVSSSSEAAPESSSEAESSSSVNSEYPYTLSTFPNVHCKDSSYFHKSSCPSSKPSLKQTVAEMGEYEPLYGIVQPVCQDYDRTVNVYTCDNGCTYSPGAFNKLEGDTIFQQEYSTIDNKYIPIQKKIAQDSAQAEASTSYPYMLASDTTVHCKTMYKTKIAKSTPSSLCETYSEGFYFKCKDGNNYEWEEMFRGENGLIERENPDE